MADVPAAPPALRQHHMDDDEQDFCRVCRSEAEDSKPLIYPCKCSGSVRYVHSDCLQEWLSHSRKRYCEICGHPYAFTKVYSSSLPSAIPTVVYLRQLLLVAGRLTWSVFRICLAIVSWLVFLPCITMASLRIILAGANYIVSPSLHYAIKSTIIDSYTDLNGTLSLANVSHTNATGQDRVLAAIASNTTYNLMPSFTTKMREDAKNFTAFVFRGQIVAISIAGGLIGLVLLREWIGQLDWNARPVVEEAGVLDPSEWVFRNGQALRFTEVVTEPPESNAATVDESERALDFGDNETVVDGRGEEREGEPRHDLVRRPSASQGEYAAPEQLEHQEDDRRTRYPALDLNELPDDLHEFVLAADRAAEELNSERSENVRGSWPPDVPVDAVAEDGGGDPGPSTRLAWLRDAPVPDNFDPSNEAHQSLSSRDRLQPIASGSGSSELRRASDPGPRGRERDQGEDGGEPLFLPHDSPTPEHSEGFREGRPDDLEHSDAAPRDALRPDYIPVVPGSESEAETVHDAAITALLEFTRTDTEDLDTDADPEGDGDGYADIDMDPEADVEEEEPLLNPPPLEQLGELELDGMGMDMVPDDEEDRPLDADDWDGIFEVIGFIGPLTGLFHNHVFVSFAMACTLLILVGLPVAIGKLFLLWTDVRMIANVITGTIQLISVIVDTILEIVTAVVRNALILPIKVVEPAVGYVTSTLNLSEVDFHPAHLADLLFRGDEAPPTSTELPHAAKMLGPLLGMFERLGANSLAIYKAWRLACVCLAGSTDVIDQFVCLVIGYMFVAASVIGVAIADAADLVHLSETFVEKARSIAVFLKVVFFMTLEIVLFPLFVGLIMDVSTLLLFNTSIPEMLTRMALRPFGTMFVAWLIGTIFMFSFATFLAHLRTICRPGALYFIRDPSDPSHSPVKDIIERPVMAQLPRLAISAIMYSLIAFSVCGAIPTAMMGLSRFGLFPKDFLPLRLDQRPLSSIPFDLLFLHLILPPSWESLRVYHLLKKGLALWWRMAVRELDLSSLILGVEVRSQPQTKTSQFMWLVTDALLQSLFGRYDNRATRARVPGNDRIELLPLTSGRREGMFIPLDHKGAPRTEADELRLLRQDRAARRVGRNPLKDYTVVNLPDYWRTRIHVLLGVGLASASLLIATLFFVPLATGRLATSYLLGTTVFDGYSWLMGLYICWGSFSLGNGLRKTIIQYSRAPRLRRSGASTRFKRATLLYLRMTYAVIALYLVLPLLVGVNFELYVSLPMRYGLSSDLTPVLHIWDAWAMGAALISLYVGAVGFMAHDDNVGPLDMSRTQRFRQAFRRPMDQSLRALHSFLLPLVIALVLPIVLPWMFFLSVGTGLRQLGVPLPLYDNSWLFRISYPFWSIFFTTAILWGRIKAVLRQVRQWMIDAEYVLEERVENYEPVDGAGLSPRRGSGSKVGATFHANALLPRVEEDGEVEVEAEADADGDDWEDIPVVDEH